LETAAGDVAGQQARLTPHVVPPSQGIPDTGVLRGMEQGQRLPVKTFGWRSPRAGCAGSGVHVVRSCAMWEFRSDTFTRPPDAMRRAMASAEVGDDVWGEDPTVRALEERAAAAVGKEAALFVPSGTMGNAIGMRLHAAQGDALWAQDASHVLDN